jgi:hypothetical protein
MHHVDGIMEFIGGIGLALLNLAFWFQLTPDTPGLVVGPRVKTQNSQLRLLAFGDVAANHNQEPRIRTANLGICAGPEVFSCQYHCAGHSLPCRPTLGIIVILRRPLDYLLVQYLGAYSAEFYRMPAARLCSALLLEHGCWRSQLPVELPGVEGASQFRWARNKG